MKVAIIGGGITGITAGRLLHQKGIDTVIFEKHNKPGGLVRCDFINGNLFHRTGGHVFNSKNTRVLEWFWSFFNRDEEFILAKRNAKILLRNKLLGYPLEDYIYQLDNETIQQIVDDILTLSKRGVIDPFTYDNFESFLLGNFGPTLYNLYFKPYNEKIWKVNLKDVSMQWLEGKLPMPNYARILTNNILRKEDDTMVHSSFYYPKNGGSQFIIDRLGQGLNIETSFTVEKVEFKNGEWYINSLGPFERIIFTGDVRTLSEILSVNETVTQALMKSFNLRSNGTSNALCYTIQSNLSWLYLPDKELLSHRIIYTGNFSENNNRPGTSTCVVEFSGLIEENVMKEEIKKLPGKLKAIAFNYEANSYVIQDHNTRNIIGEIKECLRPFGFYLAGRFAEWEYYNMDKAMESAFLLTDEISKANSA